MVKIVSVKFKEGGKSYYFAPGKETYQKGMGVIVETAKGLEYATVVVPDGEADESQIVSPLKPVVRIATAKDEEQVRRNKERRGEAMKLAQQKIEERGLDMKLVDCEFAFDGNKVAFYFTAESRVDFRELIKDLSSAFHSRIELRQISIREEIKMTGGLAPCGRECCCINCMKEPLKVSVKMAKNQGLSLNPSKISGLCGRLMCCLSYENDYYSEVCKQVPKVGSEIDTPDGRGMVVNVNMLKMTVKVKIEQNDAVSYHDFTVDEIRNGKRAPKEESADGEESNSTESAAEAESRAPENRGERAENNQNKNRNRNKNRDRKREGAEAGGGENKDRGGRYNERNNNDGNGDRTRDGKNRADRNDRGNGKGERREKQNPQNKQNGQGQGGQNNQNAQNRQGQNGQAQAQNQNGQNGAPRSGRNRHRRRNGNGSANPNPAP